MVYSHLFVGVSFNYYFCQSFMKTRTLKKDKVNVITLGCSKNLVDSENIMTQLKANDIDVAHETNDDANIIIVNTCGFIDLAKEESINTILFKLIFLITGSKRNFSNHTNLKISCQVLGFEKIKNALFGHPV